MKTQDTKEKKEFPGNISPLSSKGWPKWIVYLLSLFGLVYLLNPTFGIFELLPDNLPWIGNLDEGAAALALWYGYLEIKKARNRGK